MSTSPTVVEPDFERAISPLRGELHAHCYRMLGSVDDADDALQDALLGAWQGFASFEQRSSLRTWLYTVATHACLRVASRRPKRITAADYGPPENGLELAPRVDDPIWLSPYPADPGASLEALESIELAFVAALQVLPGRQRATLILRDVLAFEASEVASILGMTVAAVNSAHQRARATLDRSGPATSQQKTLRELGDAGEQALVASFVDAWQRSDVPALVKLLTEDARFAMPPIPTWFSGKAAVGRFFGERVFSMPWKLVPMRANGQLAFACYAGPQMRLSALNVITVRGQLIAETTGFLHPDIHRRFSIPSSVDSSNWTDESRSRGDSNRS